MPLQEVPRWSRSGVSAVGGGALEGSNREGVSEGLPSFRHSLQSAPYGFTRQEVYRRIWTGKWWLSISSPHTNPEPGTGS